MAKKKVDAEEAGEALPSQRAVPSFTLRADGRGHIFALIAAAEKLEGTELAEALATIREFELFEEAGRVANA